jgi:hypothetical protein
MVVVWLTAGSISVPGGPLQCDGFDLGVLLESNTSGKSAIGDTHKTEKSLKPAFSEERVLVIIVWREW